MEFRRFFDSFFSFFGCVLSILAWYGVRQWPEPSFFIKYPLVGPAFGILGILFLVYLIVSLFRNAAKPWGKERQDIADIFMKIWELADVGRNICRQLLNSGKIKDISRTQNADISAFFNSKRSAVYSEFPDAIDKSLFKLAESAQKSRWKRKVFIKKCAKILDNTLDFKAIEDFCSIRRGLAFDEVERYLSNELLKTDKQTFLIHLSAEINKKIEQLKQRRKYWKLTYLFFPELKKLMNTRFDENRFFKDPRIFEVLLRNSLMIEKYNLSEFITGGIITGFFVSALADLLGDGFTEILNQFTINIGADLLAGFFLDLSGVFFLFRLFRGIWRAMTDQDFKDFRKKMLEEAYKFVDKINREVIEKQQKSCEVLVVKLHETFANTQQDVIKKARKYSRIT